MRGVKGSRRVRQRQVSPRRSEKAVCAVRGSVRALDYWAIPFFFGFVFIGHFFWAGRPLYGQPWAFMTIALPWLAVLGFGLWFDLPKIPTLLPALLGVLAGRFFWPLPPV